MTQNTFVGLSEAAQLLGRTQDSIVQRQQASVILSRQSALELVFEAWQETNESWKIGEGETPVTEAVMETACRLIQALPLGVPSPAITGEPDGHISLEWYRNPRRVMTVSIGPDSRLHWAALIGSEDPRGSARFADRIPKSLLYYISRVFAG